MKKTIQQAGKWTIERVKSETPTTFKKIRTAGWISVGLGMGIKIVACFVVPPIGLTAIATEMIAIGFIAATGSSLTRKK